VAERNGAEGLNAFTALDETVISGRCRRTVWSCGRGCGEQPPADTVPREFYKERDVVVEERRMRTDSNPIGRLVEQFLATAYVAHKLRAQQHRLAQRGGHITATRRWSSTRSITWGRISWSPWWATWKAADAMPVLAKYFSKVPPGPKPEEIDHHRAKTVLPRRRWPSASRRSRFTSKAITGPIIAAPTPRSNDAISDILSNGRVSRLYRSLVRDAQIAAEAQGLQSLSRRQVPGTLRALCRFRCRDTRRREMREAIHKGDR